MRLNAPHTSWQVKSAPPLAVDIISRTKALRELILDTIRTVSTFAISNQEAFMEKVRSASQLRQAEAAKDAKRKLSKDKKAHCRAGYHHQEAL